MCVLSRVYTLSHSRDRERARACAARGVCVAGGVCVHMCVFSGARALTEFTLRHHAGTLNKCLNGRIVHYQPGVAG